MWWKMKRAVYVSFGKKEFREKVKILKEHGIEYNYKHVHIKEPFKYWYDRGRPKEPDDDNFKDLYEIRVWEKDHERAHRLMHPNLYINR